ncbi:hypothetical protein C7212DRAFT_321588, partial [Tuber magnatum]
MTAMMIQLHFKDTPSSLARFAFLFLVSCFLFSLRLAWSFLPLNIQARKHTLPRKPNSQNSSQTQHTANCYNI